MPTQRDDRTATDDVARAGQRAFAAALIDPEAPPPSDLALVGGKTPAKRFGVYRNNVVASLISALSAAYPTVKKLVGDAFFDAMAVVYVRAHPPSSPLMIFYGEAFPGWVAGFPPAQSVPYLADVARIERLRREAYHAADARPLDAAGFHALVAARPPDALESMVFEPHPATRLLRSAHPAFSIWAQVNGYEVEMTAGGQDVLVARPQDDVETRALPPGAFPFLTALFAGATLSAAAEAAAAETPEFDLASHLAGLLESGAAATVRFSA